MHARHRRHPRPITFHGFTLSSAGAPEELRGRNRRPAAAFAGVEATALGAEGTPLTKPGNTGHEIPMRAILLEEPGRFASIDAPFPSAPAPGDALVRVRRIGVCGTDLQAYCGNQPFFT